MATSFTDIMERIKADLAAGSLAALVATYWPDKALARRIAFKPRLQIGIDELPVLMITSPADEKGDRSSFDRQHREEIRLYFGFHDTDPERAPIRMVKAVEALDDDILRYRPTSLGGIGLPPGCEDIRTTATIRDEGYLHPVYFFVTRAEIDYRREYL